MTDLLLTPNWILIIGAIVAAACLLWQFHTGALVDKRDPSQLPAAYWRHLERRSRR